MNISTVKFADIVEDSYNPRKDLRPGDPAYEKLRKSIEGHGYIEPLVWNKRTGHIVGGHQRLKVLKELGETEADMSVIDVDEREEKMLNLRLNRIKGRWDYDKLEELVNGFTLDDALLAGFGSDEYALMLARADEFEMDDFEYEDEPEEAEEEEYAAEDFEGASWVVAIHFRNAENARTWCEAHGYAGAVKNAAQTTVIRA